VDVRDKHHPAQVHNGLSEEQTAEVQRAGQTQHGLVFVDLSCARHLEKQNTAQCSEVQSAVQLHRHKLCQSATAESVPATGLGVVDNLVASFSVSH
jgi:hypothetical protein